MKVDYMYIHDKLMVKDNNTVEVPPIYQEKHCLAYFFGNKVIKPNTPPFCFEVTGVSKPNGCYYTVGIGNKKMKYVELSYKDPDCFSLKVGGTSGIMMLGGVKHDAPIFGGKSPQRIHVQCCVNPQSKQMSWAFLVNGRVTQKYKTKINAFKIGRKMSPYVYVGWGPSTTTFKEIPIGNFQGESILGGGNYAAPRGLYALPPQGLSRNYGGGVNLIGGNRFSTSKTNQYMLSGYTFRPSSNDKRQICYRVRCEAKKTVYLFVGISEARRFNSNTSYTERGVYSYKFGGSQEQECYDGNKKENNRQPIGKDRKVLTVDCLIDLDACQMTWYCHETGDRRQSPRNIFSDYAYSEMCAHVYVGWLSNMNELTWINPAQFGGQAVKRLVQQPVQRVQLPVQGFSNIYRNGVKMLGGNRFSTQKTNQYVLSKHTFTPSQSRGRICYRVKCTAQKTVYLFVGLSIHKPYNSNTSYTEKGAFSYKFGGSQEQQCYDGNKKEINRQPIGKDRKTLTVDCLIDHDSCQMTWHCHETGDRRSSPKRVYQHYYNQPMAAHVYVGWLSELTTFSWISPDQFGKRGAVQQQQQQLNYGNVPLQGLSRDFCGKGTHKIGQNSWSTRNANQYMLSNYTFRPSDSRPRRMAYRIKCEAQKTVYLFVGISEARRFNSNTSYTEKGVYSYKFGGSQEQECYDGNKKENNRQPIGKDRKVLTVDCLIDLDACQLTWYCHETGDRRQSPRNIFSRYRNSDMAAHIYCGWLANLNTFTWISVDQFGRAGGLPAIQPQVVQQHHVVQNKILSVFNQSYYSNGVKFLGENIISTNKKLQYVLSAKDMYPGQNYAYRVTCNAQAAGAYLFLGVSKKKSYNRVDCSYTDKDCWSYKICGSQEMTCYGGNKTTVNQVPFGGTKPCRYVEVDVLVDMQNQSLRWFVPGHGERVSPVRIFPANTQLAAHIYIGWAAKQLTFDWINPSEYRGQNAFNQQFRGGQIAQKSDFERKAEQRRLEAEKRKFEEERRKFKMEQERMRKKLEFEKMQREQEVQARHQDLLALERQKQEELQLQLEMERLKQQEELLKLQQEQQKKEEELLQQKYEMEQQRLQLEKLQIVAQEGVQQQQYQQQLAQQQQLAMQQQQMQQAYYQQLYQQQLYQQQMQAMQLQQQQQFNPQMGNGMQMMGGDEDAEHVESKEGESDFVDESAPPMKPTLFPCAHFNANKDAEALEKSMRGFGVRDKLIADILGSRSQDQRQKIVKAYQALYQRHLVDDIKKKVNSKLFNAVNACLFTPYAYDAYSLHECFNRFSNDTQTLVEILCTRDHSVLSKVAVEYKKMYGKSLQADIEKNVGGKCGQLLAALASGRRVPENEAVDISQCKLDARNLYDAGIKKIGTDFDVFIKIFSTRSFRQLRCVFDEYNKICEYDMIKSIDKECTMMQKSIGYGLKTIVRAAESPSDYFAERLSESLGRFSNDTSQLTRIIVTRSEIDLARIGIALGKKSGKTLRKIVNSYTSGSYQRILLNLCGANDKLMV